MATTINGTTGIDKIQPVSLSDKPNLGFKNHIINGNFDIWQRGTPSSIVNVIGVQKFALTTTWQKFTKTVTLPSIVGKTLGTDGVHTSFTLARFWLDAGTNFNSRTDNLGHQSGTFDIAQVQLEEGSVATPFEQRPIGLEKRLCRDYYRVLSYVNFSGETVGGGSMNYSMVISPMRTTPTITETNHFSLNVASISTTVVGDVFRVFLTPNGTNRFVNRESTFILSAEL
jgi:hypothetical protein